MNQDSGFDFQEVLRRAFKYLVEGLIVAVVAYVLPRKKLAMEEVAMIAVTAAASFALLDMVSPSVARASRAGAGFSIGAGLVGGVPMA